MVNLRVPYPLGFYAKLDGRNASTIRRRLEEPRPWATTGHAHAVPQEGGKGTRPKVVKFQLRPDPLAK